MRVLLEDTYFASLYMYVFQQSPIVPYDASLFIYGTNITSILHF